MILLSVLLTALVKDLIIEMFILCIKFLRHLLYGSIRSENVSFALYIFKLI